MHHSAARAAFCTSLGAFAHLWTTPLPSQARHVVVTMSEMSAPISFKDSAFPSCVLIITRSSFYVFTSAPPEIIVFNITLIYWIHQKAISGIVPCSHQLHLQCTVETVSMVYHSSRVMVRHPIPYHSHVVFTSAPAAMSSFKHST